MPQHCAKKRLDLTGENVLVVFLCFNSISQYFKQWLCELTPSSCCMMLILN